MNKPRLIVGVDPGYEGGIAVINLETGQAEVSDIPIETIKIDGKNRRRYRRKELLGRFHCIKKSGEIVLVVIEEQRIYGCEGRKSAFSLGRGYGNLEMAIDARNLPVKVIDAKEWKHAMSLTSDKELSRQTVMELYPQLTNEFRFKKSHGKAEALLLAKYGQDFLLNDFAARRRPYTKYKKIGTELL